MRKMTKIGIITTLVLTMLFSVVLFSACNYERGDIRDFYGEYYRISEGFSVVFDNPDYSPELRHRVLYIDETKFAYPYWDENNVEYPVYVEHNYPVELVDSLTDTMKILDGRLVFNKKGFYIKYDNGNKRFFETHYENDAWGYVTQTYVEGNISLRFRGGYADNLDTGGQNRCFFIIATIQVEIEQGNMLEYSVEGFYDRAEDIKE